MEEEKSEILFGQGIAPSLLSPTPFSLAVDGTDSANTTLYVCICLSQTHTAMCFVSSQTFICFCTSQTYTVCVYACVYTLL